MPQGVTSEREAAKQNHIEQKHQRADADAERRFARGRIDKPECFPNVDREHDDEEEREIEKIPVDVLHDQREGTLAQISLPRFADRARRRISPEGFVIRAAIVIAGQPQAAGGPENEQRRRKQEPARPPRRLRSEPTVGRGAENLGRIKRREIGAEKIMVPLERSPSGVNDERPEAEKNKERLRPPDIRTHRLTEMARRESSGLCLSHELQRNGSVVGMPSAGGVGIGSKPANMVSASGTVLSGTQSQTEKNLSHIASTRGFLWASSIACCDFHSDTSMIVPSFARMITGTRSVTRLSFRNVGTRPRTSSRSSASCPGFGRYATTTTIPAMKIAAYSDAGCDSTKTFADL